QGRPVGTVGAVEEFTPTVDVALDDVAVEAPRGGSAAFQVDLVTRGQGAESGQAQGLAHDLGGEEAGTLLGGPPRRGQADSIDGQRAAELEVGDEGAGVDGDRGRIVRVLDGLDSAEFFDDSGEHVTPRSEWWSVVAGGVRRLSAGREVQQEVRAEPRDR